MNAWLPHTRFKGIGYTPRLRLLLWTWNNVAAIASNCCVGFVADRISPQSATWRSSWIFCIVTPIVYAPCSSSRTTSVLIRPHAPLRLRSQNYAATAASASLMPDSADRNPQHRRFVVPGVRPLRRLRLLDRSSAASLAWLCSRPLKAPRTGRRLFSVSLIHSFSSYHLLPPVRQETGGKSMDSSLATTEMTLPTPA